MIYDQGASVAVTLEGELVVDLWGGTAATDASPSAPWERDTIINVWSTTKTLSALACLVLAENGELDPVRQGRRGVAGVRRRWQGRHRDPPPDEPHGRAAGVAGADRRWTTSTTGRRRRRCSPPRSRGGSRARRRATTRITQGYLEGEVVRRITGQTIGEFVAKEITGPLGADFHIGTAPEHDARVAHVVPPSAPLSAAGADPDSIAMRTLQQHRRSRPPVSATIPWRRAEIPAAGGHGNARSVALCTPRWRAAARPTACACCRRRRSTSCSTSSATAPISSSASRCATASASGCRARRCRSAPTSGPASGVAGAGRWPSSTSTPG